ncbi:hypothetical protein MTR67_046550 [Solanum verrucosum]|uniref:Uncharacterized protein n=1 Tax=Solanum verrucosum TaxID=315347 RepID=A0AAF0ZXQ2_SOLVR|nr:hypothetical protein MTR67_046550 [Solanum verrucosum]
MSSSSFHIKKSSKICTNNIDDLSLVKSTTLANWYEEFEVLSRNYKKAQEPSSRYYKMMKMNMCVTSSYDDVVVVEKSVYNNSRLPEKSPAPVVKFNTCRPWSKHV